MSSKVDSACPPTPQPSITTEESSEKNLELSIDKSCEDKSINYIPRSEIFIKPDEGCGDIATQTKRETGQNPENPNSLTNMPAYKEDKLSVEPCIEKIEPETPPKTPFFEARNPITGLGLNGDGVGGLKPKKPKDRRDGNPVTGEGYKTPECSTTPSMNGANQVINKNRIPPGGFSSGLW